jgi:hypothetical protein
MTGSETTVSSATDFSPKLLSLGACQANRDPSVSNGEKVVLRVPILRQGNAVIDPSQVDIDVYFFDRVNGEKSLKPSPMSRFPHGELCLWIGVVWVKSRSMSVIFYRH